MRRRSSNGHGLARSLAMVMGLVLMTACTPGDDGPVASDQLETVDLEEPRTFTPDDDPRAAPRQGQLAGILPDDFPADLPLHLPASVDAFGSSSAGRSVELVTSSSPKAVRDALARALRSKGWRGEVTIGTSSLEKNGKSVRLTIEAGAFGSRYSYLY